jgi:calmodulin
MMMMTIPTEKDMQESFKIFDPRGEKAITFAGLKRLLNAGGVALGDEEIQQIVRELDGDGDGKITYEELKKLMKR